MLAKREGKSRPRKLVLDRKTQREIGARLAALDPSTLIPARARKVPSVAPSIGDRVGPPGAAQHVPTDEPRAAGARCSRTKLVVTLTDGRELCVPLTWFDRLLGAPAKPLRHVEVTFGGRGIRLPDADEDISVERLLASACAVCLEREWRRTRQHPRAQVQPRRIMLERSGGWWVIPIPEIAGAYSQWHTRAEAHANLLDALAGLVEARNLRSARHAVPQPRMERCPTCGSQVAAEKVKRADARRDFIDRGGKQNAARRVE